MYERASRESRVESTRASSSAAWSDDKLLLCNVLEEGNPSHD